MDRRIAKELLHIEAWLERVDEIVARGKDDYLEDELLQEAGDSLMMKLGEATNRLSRMEARSPAGIDWALATANRNFIIHQYDAINRSVTWLTLPSTSASGNRRFSPRSERRNPHCRVLPNRPTDTRPVNARQLGPWTKLAPVRQTEIGPQRARALSTFNRAAAGTPSGCRPIRRARSRGRRTSQSGTPDPSSARWPRVRRGGAAVSFRRPGCAPGTRW